MANENTPTPTRKINKVKVYGLAFIIYLFANFAFEIFVELIENSTKQWLYPIFPFSRIGLLIITIVIANAYIRRKEHRPKQKLWWRILKPVLLIIVFYGLAMAAWLSVSQADADRAAAETEKARQSIKNIPVPTKTELNASYEAN